MKTRKQQTDNTLRYFVPNVSVNDLHAVTSALRGTEYEMQYIGDEEIVIYLSYTAALKFCKRPDLVSFYKLKIA